jgi:hypothetical protein
LNFLQLMIAEVLLVNVALPLGVKIEPKLMEHRFQSPERHVPHIPFFVLLF